MLVKEMIVGEGERRRRFVLVCNPEEAQRDRTSREWVFRKIEESLAAIGDQKGKDHKKSVCALLSHRIMDRYTRKLKSVSITIDKNRICENSHLYGKYIISTGDDMLTAEDVALGYKQLLEVE
jgi:hypothetical protein